MKKTLLITLGLIFVGFIPHVFAQGFVPLAPIPGLTDPASATSVVNSDGFANFFNNLYKYCIGIAATLAVIEIIWGGLEISTKDSVSQQSDGKERITQAIYGLILVLSPVLVFTIINPAILNLKLAIPKLDTVSGAPIPVSALVTVGQSRTCADGTDLASCVAANQAACTAAGGSIQTSSGNAYGSEQINCIPKNQNVVSPGSSIAADKCITLTTHPAPGQQAFTPQVISASDASDCNASSISNLEAAYNLTYCANITGGGVCLYNQ